MVYGLRESIGDESSMPSIELPEADDKQLRELAPAYLQGDRNHAARVRWLIEEFVRIRNGASSDSTTDEPGMIDVQA